MFLIDVIDTTNLTLILNGYDTVSSKITDATGSVVLIDKKDNIAAEWHFSDLMKHWNRKHSLTAYIPSKSDKKMKNANIIMEI